MNMAIKEKKSPADILAKVVRVATVAPFMALILLSFLYFGNRSGMISTVGDYVAAISFLVVLPLLSYPLQPLIPKFRDGGREGQRNLAMIGSFIGYVLGVAYALIFRLDTKLPVLFLTYLGSVLVLIVVNKVFKFKASGHGCGLMGPVAVLAYYFGWIPLAAGVVLFAAVIWSSIKMKRHTALQLIVGAAVPIILFNILIRVM